MTSDSDPHRPAAEPGDVAAEGGAVILDGPDAVAATLLPDAAEETGNRLVAAAEQARGQTPGDGT